MNHIVLLGDSIFDNKAYVGNEPDIISHLQSIIPQNWQATLKAIDGSLVENTANQLQNSPENTTHFIISAGGNNALMNIDVLNLKLNSSAEMFGVLSNRVSSFEAGYHKLLKMVLSRNVPTAVCTIYYPNFSESSIQSVAVAALSSFNDVIIRQAILAGIPFIDLRLTCNEKDDYANEIEPSSKGAKKIAAKILEIVQNHDFSKKRTSVYF